jgi:methylmalonyl-CoA mutase, C-terminal domain
MSSLQLLNPTKNPEARKIRILVAKPGLDGHDRGALVLSRAFRDAGMEVIYSGLLPTPEQVAQMAVDEDVDIVALSLLNGAHMTAFPKVLQFLKQKGGADILVIGGGIIPDVDKPKLEKMGIHGNFGPGTSLKTIVEFIKTSVKENRERIARKGKRSDLSTSRKSKKAFKRPRRSSK